MSNVKKVRKTFLVWDFEAEDRWLNTMAQEGWVLDRVGFGVYYFRSCEPGEYTVRLEMKEMDDDYIRFMEETGAEYIGRVFNWIYFSKKTEMGPFDIFSDIDSKINHMNKIGRMLAIVGGANLIIGLVNAMIFPEGSIICLLGSTLLMYALGRIHGKKESLEHQRLLTG